MRGRRGGPDRFIGWKLALLFLGGAFLIYGMAAGADWAVLTAIGVMAAGVLIRFLPENGKDEE